SINRTLNELAGLHTFQLFGSMVGLFRPRLIDEVDTTAIDHDQLVALFTQHYECCPSGMCFESKSNFHRFIPFGTQDKFVINKPSGEILAILKTCLNVKRDSQAERDFQDSVIRGRARRNLTYTLTVLWSVRLKSPQLETLCIVLIVVSSKSRMRCDSAHVAAWR